MPHHDRNDSLTSKTHQDKEDREGETEGLTNDTHFQSPGTDFLPNLAPGLHMAHGGRAQATSNSRTHQSSSIFVLCIIHTSIISTTDFDKTFYLNVAATSRPVGTS